MSDFDAQLISAKESQASFETFAMRIIRAASTDSMPFVAGYGGQQGRREVVCGTYFFMYPHQGPNSSHWNQQRGMKVPHMLCCVDYLTGFVKMPAGWVDEKEDGPPGRLNTLVRAMNREFHEETGYEGYFKETDFHKTSCFGALVIHRFLKVVGPRHLDGMRWKPVPIPCRGETAGVAFMPLVPSNAGEYCFPASAVRVTAPATDTGKGGCCRQTTLSDITAGLCADVLSVLHRPGNDVWLKQFALPGRQFEGADAFTSWLHYYLRDYSHYDDFLRACHHQASQIPLVVGHTDPAVEADMESLASAVGSQLNVHCNTSQLPSST